jgi:hypothetical protein
MNACHSLTLTNLMITLTCRGNLILADCLEDRVIHSRDYVRPATADSSMSDSSISRTVTRKLQQAMIPGPELVRVQQVQRLGHGLGLEQGTTTPAAANNQAILG